MVALVAAIAFAVAFEVVGSTVGALIRSRQRARGVRAARLGGRRVAGALIGFAIVWVLGAMALQLPGQADLRRAVQRSYVLQRLNEIVPPRSLLNALARIDPFPSFAGPPRADGAARPARAAQAGVRAAAPSVVRVLGTACGLGVEGSGWVAANGLVVTAAHVVAGEEDTEVVPSSGGVLRAQAVAFDSHNDVAVLRVDGLEAPPLQLKDPHPGAAIAIVGYPLNGPLEASAGRIGETETVLAQDAYGEGQTRRLVTSAERDGPARQLRRSGGGRLRRRPVDRLRRSRRGRRRLRRARPRSCGATSPRRSRRSRPAPASASRVGRAPRSGCLKGGIT